MPRVKRGTTKAKSRRNILRATKGYIFGRSTKKRQAREAIYHAGNHAFSHRRDKKNNFRRLWQVKINAKLEELNGPSFSKFIGFLNKQDIQLNRKMLADLAEHHPETFKKVVDKTQ